MIKLPQLRKQPLPFQLPLRPLQRKRPSLPFQLPLRPLQRKRPSLPFQLPLRPLQRKRPSLPFQLPLRPLQRKRPSLPIQLPLRPLQSRSIKRPPIPLPMRPPPCHPTQLPGCKTSSLTYNGVCNSSMKKFYFTKILINTNSDLFLRLQLQAYCFQF